MVLHYNSFKNFPTSFLYSTAVADRAHGSTSNVVVLVVGFTQKKKEETDYNSCNNKVRGQVVNKLVIITHDHVQVSREQTVLEHTAIRNVNPLALISND
jgi:hypothetical protein